MKLDSVAAVLEHHTQDHPELDFLWVDTFNGYTFNQSGEVSKLGVSVVGACFAFLLLFCFVLFFFWGGAFKKRQKN